MLCHDCALGQLPELEGATANQPMNLALLNPALCIEFLLLQLDGGSPDFFGLQLAIQEEICLQLGVVQNVATELLQLSPEMVLASTLKSAPEGFVLALPNEISFPGLLESFPEVIRPPELVAQDLFHGLQPEHVPVVDLVLTLRGLLCLLDRGCLRDVARNRGELGSQHCMSRGLEDRAVPRNIAGEVQGEEVEEALEGVNSCELPPRLLRADFGLGRLSSLRR
mmetsp:Transcript_49153/g.126673  ORF Transcript_49153/g.126673 Transcript_49153/m.126673 type:complete len:224 (+) Transcript_49153:3-674(+)